jgi:hypothetical protein
MIGLCFLAGDLLASSYYAQDDGQQIRIGNVLSPFR